MRATVDRYRQPFFCPHASPCQGLHQHTYYAKECQLLILNRRPRRKRIGVMNSLILISPSLVRGFQAIISGKKKEVR